MGETIVQNLDIRQVVVTKAAEFSGYNIRFEINEQHYQMLVGKNTDYIAINIKHIFRTKETCQLCGKRVFPAPLGQQICPHLQAERNELLPYFLTTYPEVFSS
ncbi:hypothetical protein KO561_13895 [Radiobacillus kanasensis]|uniref:hypothetical protein n=1 Tax=Radiobacillus kanasensis TaxID=2844358 RepID=UPI001E333657|nr:hypothetical protein [Radiobacillus kanasensis]UFT98288.1 hypothetical protein KO561_13895 [Radiobacillus kanasensis]